MENRGTGLTPGRLPGEWEKRPLELGKEAPQGAMKEGKPSNRAIMTKQPNDVSTMFKEAGSFVGGILADRPGLRQESHTPSTNSEIGGADTTGFGEEDMDHVTGKPTKGITKPRGAF